MTVNAILSLAAGAVCGALIWISAAAPASAATRTWPTVAPCDVGTLQACITGASAGDIVEIATNTPVAEDLTVDKSLTLRPATGFAPTIAGNFQFFQSTASAATIVVDSLAFTSRIRAAPGTGNLDFSLLGSTVTTSGSYNVAVSVSSGTSPPYGNVNAVIEGNTVTHTGGGVGAQCAGINVGSIFDSGTSFARIANNRVSVLGCGQGDAISVYNGPGETLTADVIGNQVDATNTNDGIMLRNFQQAPNSRLVVRAINNVVTGQLNEAGAPGGLVVSADGFQSIDATIVNNTLAHNQINLLVSGRTDLGASISGVIANNVIAFGRFGIDPDLDIAEHHNLFYPAPDPGDPFTPGPGSFIADPRLVSAADFHLSPDSPAIDRGSNAAVPGDITTDVEGNPRIQQARVDMGAYESPYVARAPTVPVPSMTPLGLLLAGLVLSLAAAFRLRRTG